MGALDELTADLGGSSRAVVIAQRDVDLRPQSPDNRMFILKVGEGSSAAGGRGGGFGERKVTAVLCYDLKSGAWAKTFQADAQGAEGFEVPYYVSRIPLTMADGSETMGYGVVEPGLVAEFAARAGIPSSP